ncbi:hypothetical protein SO802_020142, partial [Lithocarpus litseifolius]
MAEFRPVHAQIGDPATLNGGGISLNINGTHRKRQRQLVERGPVVSGFSSSQIAMPPCTTIGPPKERQSTTHYV